MNTKEFYVRIAGQGAKKININVDEGDTMYDLRKQLVDKNIVPNMVFSFQVMGIPLNVKNDFKLSIIGRVFKKPTLTEIIPLDIPIFCYKKDKIIYIFHKNKCLEMINFSQEQASIRLYNVIPYTDSGASTMLYEIDGDNMNVSFKPTQDTKLMKYMNQINKAFNGDLVTFGKAVATPEAFVFYYYLPRVIKQMFYIDKWHIIP